MKKKKKRNKAYIYLSVLLVLFTRLRRLSKWFFFQILGEKWNLEKFLMTSETDRTDTVKSNVKVDRRMAYILTGVLDREFQLKYIDNHPSWRVRVKVRKTKAPLRQLWVKPMFLLK